MGCKACARIADELQGCGLGGQRSLVTQASALSRAQGLRAARPVLFLEGPRLRSGWALRQGAQFPLCPAPPSLRSAVGPAPATGGRSHAVGIPASSERASGPQPLGPAPEPARGLRAQHGGPGCRACSLAGRG